MRAQRTLLLLFDLESLLAFLWTFLTPSESGSGVFLWLSRERLLLSAFLFLLWIAMLVVTWWLLRSPAATEGWLKNLDERLTKRRLLAPALLFLIVPPLALLAAALAVLLTPLQYSAYSRLAPDTFPLLHSVAASLLPLIVLLTVAASEGAVAVWMRYRAAPDVGGQWSLDRVGPAVLLLVLLLVTLAHWIILAFQLRVFVNIPAWYWKIEARPFGMGDLLYLLVAATLLVLIYFSISRLNRPVLTLALTFALSWFLQIGVGWMAGDGFAAVAGRYFSTYHKSYVVKAAGNHLPLWENLQRYEEIYGGDAFTNTKPPGLMGFYIGLDRLVNPVSAGLSDQARYERLSTAITYGFPLIAALMVLLLYAFVRRAIGATADSVPNVAPLLYSLAASFVLFSLFPDQAVYPLVFLAAAWLAAWVIGRGSLIWAFTLGALLYLAVFFAFTMLPLYPFVGLYLLLHAGRSADRARWKRVVWMGLAVAAGTVVMYSLGRLVLHYDFFPRFERTMSINHNFDFYLRVGQQPPGVPETLGTRLSQIVTALWVNNLDYAAAIGFPLYFLFAIQAARLIVALLKGRTMAGDIILLAMLGSFLILNLAGTAQGEVPRLWLFWLPMVAILAAKELVPHLRKRPSLLLWLGFAQLITIVLTYHFQDLRM